MLHDLQVGTLSDRDLQEAILIMAGRLHEEYALGCASISRSELASYMDRLTVARDRGRVIDSSPNVQWLPVRAA
jgi:hypothetical protein